MAEKTYTEEEMTEVALKTVFALGVTLGEESAKSVAAVNVEGARAEGLEQTEKAVEEERQKWLSQVKGLEDECDTLNNLLDAKAKEVKALSIEEERQEGYAHGYKVGYATGYRLGQEDGRLYLNAVCTDMQKAQDIEVIGLKADVDEAGKTIERLQDTIERLHKALTVEVDLAYDRGYADGESHRVANCE